MEPDFLYALWVLGGTSFGAGRHEEALSALDRAATLSGRAPYYLGWLAFGCGRAGQRERALGIIEELGDRARAEYVAPTFLAWAFSGLGETEKALDRIEKAFEEKSPSMVMHHKTLLGDLRSSERFRDIRRRMALDP